MDKPSSAFPYVVPTIAGVKVASGITKRELFAAMAMQGCNQSGYSSFEAMANDAVASADALLAELEK